MLRKAPEFHPVSDKAVNYLKKKILRLPLSDLESKFVIELDVYGTGSGGTETSPAAAAGPPQLFHSGFDDDDDHLPWQPVVVDLLSGRQYVARVLLAFTTLKKKTSGELQREVPGFGTWYGSTNKSAVATCEIDGTTTTARVTGYRRSFHFKSLMIGDQQQKPVVPGSWSMVENHIYPATLGSPDENINCDDYVLCSIIRSDDKKQIGSGQAVMGLGIDLMDLIGNQRTNLFYARCVVGGGTPSLLTIDGGSGCNLISADLVTKLELSVTKLPVPGSVRWINDESIVVDRQVKVRFRTWNYVDEVTCYVVPMTVVGILLGRPWLYDRRVTHDGFANTYSFQLNGVTFTLMPMSPQALLPARKHL